jgi:serine/threonine-protein kinase
MRTGRNDIDAILCEAVEIESAAQREAFLEEACADNADLRRRLHKLIADHFKAGHFLEEPLIAAAATLNRPVAECPGTMVGRYKLLEEIGEGGMGVVYLAEQQEPVRREVALKIIKPGMNTRQVIARFEAERQALALMDHPNIAHVLNGGETDSGEPYFVMELVRGTPIIEYCDHNRLAVRDRLELFVQICQAVQHAHQKGIIHRDIKPAHVLVTLRDGAPVPKIIDFGIAKAIDRHLTEKALATSVGPDDRHAFVHEPGAGGDEP